MIERELIITGSDAELLNNALAEVKTKAYEESEAQLDGTQTLDALVSCFRSFRKAANNGQEKESHHSYFSPLSKRLVARYDYRQATLEQMAVRHDTFGNIRYIHIIHVFRQRMPVALPINPANSVKRKSKGLSPFD